jgi:hypothetical protein
MLEPESSPEAMKQHILAMAVELKAHADHVMETYIRLKEATEVEPTPESLAVKQVFDDSERDGEHRKLLFAFHDSVYELHREINSPAVDTPMGVFKLLQLTLLSETAYRRLQASAQKHLKLAKQAAAKARS